MIRFIFLVNEAFALNDAINDLIVNNINFVFDFIESFRVKIFIKIVFLNVDFVAN